MWKEVKIAYQTTYIKVVMNNPQNLQRENISIPDPEYSGETSSFDMSVDEFPVIDANVGLGRFANGLNRELAETSETVRFLETRGIKNALVYSVFARETDAQWGNSIVLEECKKHIGLIPGFVITPYEMDINNMLRQMGTNNISVARLYPESGFFSVYPSVIGPVVEELQKAGKVLFIDFESSVWSGKIINYDAIFQLCQAFPEIPIILVGSTILGSRNYPSLLNKCKNLYLEISQIFQPEGIYRLVKQGHGKRLIFGSGFPRRDPGALLNMLVYSGISKEGIQDICYGNLRRLLNLGHVTSDLSLEKPANREIIDLHVHQANYHAPSGTENAVDIIRNMDRCGIKTVIITSIGGCFGEVKRGNRAVNDACERYPGRIFGYLTLDPKYPDEIHDQINRYADNSSFRGIKLHLEKHEVELNDRRNEIIYSLADRKGWPLLIHDRYFSFPDGVNPEDWEKVCTKYKNANFLMAHTGGMDPASGEKVQRLAELARKHKNLYFDLAASHVFPGALERLASIAGAEQIVYGSDYPMFDFAFETGRVISSSLSEEEKDMIFFKNARKLIDVD